MSHHQLYPQHLDPYAYIHPEICPFTEEMQDAMGNMVPEEEYDDIFDDIHHWSKTVIESVFSPTSHSIELGHENNFKGTSSDIHIDSLPKDSYISTLRIAPRKHPKCGTLLLLHQEVSDTFVTKEEDGEYYLQFYKKPVEKKGFVYARHIFSKPSPENEPVVALKNLSISNGELVVFRNVFHSAPPPKHLPLSTEQIFVKATFSNPRQLPPNQFSALK